MLWVYNFSNLCGSESHFGNREQNEAVFKKGCSHLVHCLGVGWAAARMHAFEDLDGLGCSKLGRDLLKPVSIL